jgi:hypothetical protein
VLPIVAGAIVVLAGLYGVMKLVNARDSAGVSADQTAGPGTYEAVATASPAPGGPPPTSGPHAPRNVTREGVLGPDELLTALEQGNVVVLYPRGRRPPAPLVALQEAVSGPFDPELAAAGQMVVLGRWPGLDRVVALAYRRRLEATGPDDPALRPFAEAWLGKGRGETG